MVPLIIFSWDSRSKQYMLTEIVGYVAGESRPLLILGEATAPDIALPASESLQRGDVQFVPRDM